MQPVKILLIGGSDREYELMEKLFASSESRSITFIRLARCEQAAEELTFNRYQMALIFVRPGGQSELRLLREIYGITPPRAHLSSYR